jgi:excisionase family DNA binding protein
MEEQLYTTTKVAKIFGVTPRTIQMWADSGMIEVTKTLGGHRRITALEVDRLSRELGKTPETSEPAVERVATRPEETEANRVVRILIVDDDKDLLKLYQMQIETWETPETEVYLASDGYDALVQIGSRKPDIIITDLKMPRMDGSHMIDVIQKNPDMAHCQVVVVTGLSKEDIKKDYALPADVLLEEKPIPFARIQRLVKDFIEHS